YWYENEAALAAAAAAFEIEWQIGVRLEPLAEWTTRVQDRGNLAADGRPFLVMPWRPMTLAKQLRVHSYRCEDAAKLLLELANILARRAELKVCCRDLNPSTVFIPPSGVAVGDFGLACRSDQPLQDLAVGLPPGVFIGTPAFCSPEQKT